MISALRHSFPEQAADVHVRLSRLSQSSFQSRPPVGGSLPRIPQAARTDLRSLWQQLAAVHVEHLVQANEPFFTALDLKKARDLVREVKADAKGDGLSSEASASVAASFSVGAP